MKIEEPGTQNQFWIFLSIWRARLSDYERYFRGTFSPERRLTTSFVTIAIVKRKEVSETATESFSSDAIRVRKKRKAWLFGAALDVIDPIDGTYAFVHGVPFYGV